MSGGVYPPPAFFSGEQHEEAVGLMQASHADFRPLRIKYSCLMPQAAAMISMMPTSIF